MRLVQEQQHEQQEHHQKYQEQQVQQIQLTLQQVSRFAAGCIITAFFIFVAGFYWGKKSVTEITLEEAAERLLTDKIHAALYRAYKTQEQNFEHKEKEHEEQSEKVQPENNLYSLHLGMFQTRKAAQACVEKLKTLECPAHIQQRSSVTMQGKHYIWYEVVIPACTTHAEVKALQTRIEKSITQQTRIITEKE